MSYGMTFLHPLWEQHVNAALLIVPMSIIGAATALLFTS
jgi:hypothetical protein